MKANIRRAILYYPTIRIRNMTWLKQVILYWDEIGTIVPHEVEHSAFQLREFQELREHGLLRFHHPEEYVREGEQLTEEFIRCRNTPRYRNMHKRYEDTRQRFEVYGSKIPPSLAHVLRENHLAKETEHQVFSVNRLDGLLFMSLLAKYLADQDDYAATTPGTDYRAYRDLVFMTGKREESMPVLSLTLEQILPVPRADTTLAQVLAFRRSRTQELLQFRQVMDNIQAELKNVTSNGELQHLIVRFSESIKIEVEKLDRLLSDANIATTYGTMDNILSIKCPDVIEGLLGAITNSILLNLVAKVVNGVVKIGKQKIDARNEQRKTLLASSYTYLYEAQKSGLIERP